MASQLKSPNSIEGEPPVHDWTDRFTRVKLWNRPKHDRRGRTRIQRWFPQWLRTALAVMVAMSSAVTWLGAAATPYQVWLAIPLASLHPVVVGGFAHVWPTYSPPWRTVAWAWMASWFVGGGTYLVWHITWSLYLAAATLVLVTVVRCNCNGRKLWNRLVQAHIRRRLGGEASLKSAA